VDFRSPNRFAAIAQDEVPPGLGMKKATSPQLQHSAGQQRAGLGTPNPAILAAVRRTALALSQRKEATPQLQHSAGQQRAGKKKARRHRYQHANYLMTLLPEEVGGSQPPKTVDALGKQEAGSKLVEAVVDSGAADSVVPPGMFAGKVVPSEMSKSGRRYSGPNGSPIDNLGEVAASFRVDEGFKCGLRMQVANVQRPLIAASQLSAGGNRVVLEEHGGSITNVKTGRQIKIHRKGGVYVLNMWISSSEASSFPRQGKK
jgi:hypothetical protein